MDGSRPMESISGDAAAGEEAFKLLSDSTRIDVLQALWEAHDPRAAGPVPFSAIRERVGVDDPGRLNYHLDKLTPQFLHHSEEGYELREAGQRIVRVLIAGTATEDRTIDPVEIDVGCIFCGGSTEISYEDGFLSHRCRDCSARCVRSYPAGLLSQEELPPAGLLARTPEEVYRQHRVWTKHREASVMEGVCPECSGSMPVEEIRICDDHEPDPDDEAVCSGCGSIFWGLVFSVCDICKLYWQIPTVLYPPTHPAVVAFYYDHGVEFDLASHEQRARLLEYREEVVSEDPLRMRITVPAGGDELSLTYDDQMRVVAVAH